MPWSASIEEVMVIPFSCETVEDVIMAPPFSPGMALPTFKVRMATTQPKDADGSFPIPNNKT